MSDATPDQGSAELSDERAKFEAWSRARPDGGYTLDRYDDPECTEYIHYASQYAWEAWVAATQPAPSAEPWYPNDEQLNAAIESALPLLDKDARKALTYTRWKDGIDCDYLTVHCRGFIGGVLLNLEDARAAATQGAPTPAQGAIPSGWVLVPKIGTVVRADHPQTCLNPEPTFEVTEVRAESSGSGFAVRGERTCWFGISGVRAGDAGKTGESAASPSTSNESEDKR